MNIRYCGGGDVGGFGGGGGGRGGGDVTGADRLVKITWSVLANFMGMPAYARPRVKVAVYTPSKAPPDAATRSDRGKSPNGQSTYGWMASNSPSDARYSSLPPRMAGRVIFPALPTSEHTKRGGRWIEVMHGSAYVEPEQVDGVSISVTKMFSPAPLEKVFWVSSACGRGM